MEAILIKIVDTINMFNTKSISAIIDSLFGDGSFDDIASFIESVPDKTMGDVIDWLEDNGITVDLVEEVLEGLLPEDNIFGTIPFDEIKQTLEDEDFLKSTIKENIIEMVNISGEDFDSEITDITDALAEIKESTLFELLENIFFVRSDCKESTEVFASELEDEEEPDFDICFLLLIYLPLIFLNKLNLKFLVSEFLIIQNLLLIHLFWHLYSLLALLYME